MLSVVLEFWYLIYATYFTPASESFTREIREWPGGPRAVIWILALVIFQGTIQKIELLPQSKGIIQDQTLLWADKKFGNTGRHSMKWCPDLSVASSMLTEVLLCCSVGGVVMSFSIAWVTVLGESWNPHAFLLSLYTCRSQKLSLSSSTKRTHFFFKILTHSMCVHCFMVETEGTHGAGEVSSGFAFGWPQIYFGVLIWLSSKVW